MNYDLALVASVLENRDLATPLKAGIRPKMLSEEVATYWDIIQSHYERYLEVPSPEFFHGICPQYEHIPPANTMEAIITEVKVRYLHEEIDNKLQQIAKVNALDPFAAKRELLQAADTLNVEMNATGRDLIAGEDKEHVLKTLDMLQQNNGLLGLPWPWEYLNQNTIGLMPGNFVYIYGREKCRKTFLELYMTLFWESLGYRTLFDTGEMTEAEIAWRLYPMRAGLPVTEMTHGNISSDGRRTLEQALDDLAFHKNVIISPPEGGGLAELAGKIDLYNPHILIVDYMKGIAEDEMGDKFNPNHESKYVARVADKLKRMAQVRKLPIIACGHANREGIKLKGKGTEELAHSDQIARRADLVIRVITDEVNERMACIVTAGRAVRKFLSWTLDVHLDHRFGDFLGTDTSWVDDVDAMDEAEDKARERAEESPEKDESKSLKDLKKGLKSFKPTRRS